MEVLTYTEVDAVEGEAGDFRVTVTKKPRYILEDKCTGCTTCVEYCPAQYPDPYNQEISKNKAVHIYFAQAIPLITYIDESCLYLKEKKCRICEGVCQNKAIDLNQTPEKKELRVGAIILSTGMEPFDPSVKREYHYGDFANIVTSMDYERLLSSTGPYQGEILRASDKKHPHKIAWIQCVGSRRVTQGDNSYCSAVCCTYTQKQVILTKEHYADADCTVFHNDIRSYGKDFERYYDRAANLPNVRFIRSYVSIVREDPETKNVVIRYATNDEGVKEEEFDLVVLSVGLNPPIDAQSLASKFGVQLNDHRFCQTSPVNPMATNRKGIFVTGAFQGPVDIPESVFSASGAGSQVGELLNYRRGDLSQEREYPPERDVSQEEPKIGVFVCHCGANIGRIVNVPEVVEYCKTLPNVVHAQEQLFSCATNSAKQITDVTREMGLNRVIVAACSPRTLEPLFRDTVREAGINQYYFEMANIREHNSWVHSKEKDEATQKAKDIIRMSVARARRLAPLQEFDLGVNKAALVLGGGVAGMNCALSIANQGHQVHLVEKSSELGGVARKIHFTSYGLDMQEYLRDLIAKVYKHPLIHVYHDATITEATGYVGNFVTSVRSDKGLTQIKHGAAVIAIGADLYKPSEYLYGQDERVLTQLELEERIAQQDEKITNASSLVMIQCVGCRNEERNYCSRICCSVSVKHALKLKEINPDMDIYILFRDMRTYGYNEDYYREASNKDVKFIRYEPDDKPEVEPGESEDGRPVLKVTVTDFVLGKKLVLDADVISLAAAVVPSASTNDVAGLFKVTLNPDGFFKEAHVKLRPVDFATDGVYVCGAAHYPKFLPETVNQSFGAAGRALTLLSRDVVVASGAVCDVDESKCVSCGACITACTYGAIDFYETAMGRKARVNPVLCKGDGVCNAKCPTNAIQLKHFTDEEIISEIDVAFPEEEVEQTLDIAVGYV
uniref:CoB--CoM heterodisulfide reductase iron-sulfur subunit A family protein n=1 Tax=Desulfomonile tiedjei TaxID=2358 RepID=A0A7C4EU97_9BACT